MVVVRATVIKIARAIIILKPAFLVVPSPGRWSRRQGVAEGWCRTTGEERLARERSVVDIGRGTGRRRWKRMAAAVTATEAGWPARRTAGLAPCTLGIEVRDDQPGEGRGGGRRARWRRTGEGGSFISLPHGIIYREDFRESTQRAPR